MEMKVKGKTQLAGSNIRFIVPATQAASRRMTISKPSLEMRVMYSEGSDEGIVVRRSRFPAGGKMLYEGCDSWEDAGGFRCERYAVQWDRGISGVVLHAHP